MARKKLKLAYITDDTMRKQSFKHRKKGFIKKLHEIKTLCGVDACAVIYNQSNPNPEVWPSNVEVKNVIEKFEKLTANNQTHRSVNHQEFLTQYIAKVEKKNKRMVEDNNEDCLREVMFKCLGGKEFHMNDNERRDLCKYIDQYLKVLLHHKNVTLNNPHFEIGGSSSMAPTNMDTNLAPIPFLMTRTTNMTTNMAPIPALMAPPTNMATNMAPIPFLMAPTTNMATNMAPIPALMAPPTNMATNMAPISALMAPPTNMATNMAPIPALMVPPTNMATNMTPIPALMAPPTNMATNMAPISALMAPPTNMATNMAPIPALMAPTTNMATNMAPIPALMVPPTNMATNMTPIPALMAPTTMDEASPSSFLNAPSFTFPQLSNELQSIVSSNQQLAQQVNSLATNLLPNNNQDLHIQSMDQAIIPSYQGPEHFNYLASDFFPGNNQEIYIPVTDQNEFHYQDQEQNQEKGFVDEMMNYADQTGFPWMEEDNNHNQF